MKILFVANRVPYPPFRGDKLKIFNLANELCKHHELHLITIAENQDDVNSVKELLKPTVHLNENGQQNLLFHSLTWQYRPKWLSAISACFGVFSNRPLQVAFFRSSGFADRLKQILSEHQFDAIHVQHIRMAQYFEGLGCENVILDLPDAFSLYWKRRIAKSGNFISKWVAAIEFKRLFNYEKKMLPKFKKVLVCSREDQQFLNENTGVNVELLQNGVNTDVFSPRADAFIKNRVLFTGNMDYAPNIDAVSYFVEEIWPKIIQKVPEAQFIIAGQRPVAKVMSLQNENIHVTGFIPNLADEYAKAHVVVSPLRIGAGTQNKVLEALSMNIPVVSTNVGYSGLELEKGVGIALSLNADEFAENVIQILCNNDFRDKLGSTGGQKIRSRFSWQGIALQLEAYLKQVAKPN
jgi:sugar transferase (PEP-CTERM/EpsH1 system associated)